MRVHVYDAHMRTNRLYLYIELHLQTVSFYSSYTAIDCCNIRLRPIDMYVSEDMHYIQCEVTWFCMPSCACARGLLKLAVCDVSRTSTYVRCLESSVYNQNS